MADVTARLIWYRLRENYESLAQTYEEFSWRRVDILDMLFLGWVLLAFAVVGLVNVYLRFFGLPKAFQRRRGLDWRSVDGSGSQANSGGLRGGETIQWINAAFGWMYENYPKRPEFIENWLKALSEEAKKYTERDVQIRFDGVQAGGSPPQFSNVSTDVREKSSLTVLANLTCTDLTLLVSMITKTATHMQTTGCQVRVAKLSGPLRVQSKPHENPGDLELSFQSTPEITLHVSPNSYSTSIDQSMVESVIQKTLSRVVLHISFPGAGSLETISRSLIGCQATSGAAPAKFSRPSSGSGANWVDSTADHDLSRSFARLSSGSFVQPAPKADRRIFSDNHVQQGLRLLVKLIKANGLMDKDFISCDPYCTVSADEPAQQHSTSVVKNTINPFFDEYFLLDITNSTKQIKFEVFDRSKQKEDDFLGQASVVLDDLRRLPSSRQIIPLTGRPRASTTTSGSVTVEFLFMETNETATPGRASALETSPPRRRIEMSHALMPGGMTVTTKTTTTERLRDQRDDPLKYNDSPTRVEKAETVSTYASDSSPYTSGTSSRAGVRSSTPSTSQDQVLTNGVDSVTETALRQLSRQPQTSSQSATIVITGVQKEPSIPIIMTTKPPNTKPNKDTLSPGGSDQPVETKKKSFASALKKRFSRSKKSRSQSADRAQTFRDESLLRPPDHADTTVSDQSEFSEGTLRKSRSHSFSSGFRNLFRRKKKGNMSRESSMSRISARGVETSREDSTGQPSPQLPQPKGSTARHNTPAPDFSPTTGHPYSTSVPARPSPLYDH